MGRAPQRRAAGPMGSSHGSHLPGSAGGIPRYSRPAVRALTVPAGSWRLGCVDGRWASSFSSPPRSSKPGRTRSRSPTPPTPSGQGWQSSPGPGPSPPGRPRSGSSPASRRCPADSPVPPRPGPRPPREAPDLHVEDVTAAHQEAMGLGARPLKPLRQHPAQGRHSRNPAMSPPAPPRTACQAGKKGHRPARFSQRRPQEQRRAAAGAGIPNDYSEPSPRQPTEPVSPTISAARRAFALTFSITERDAVYRVARCRPPVRRGVSGSGGVAVRRGVRRYCEPTTRPPLARSGLTWQASHGGYERAIVSSAARGAR